MEPNKMPNIIGELIRTALFPMRVEVYTKELQTIESIGVWMQHSKKADAAIHKYEAESEYPFCLVFRLEKYEDLARLLRPACVLLQTTHVDFFVGGIAKNEDSIENSPLFTTEHKGRLLHAHGTVKGKLVHSGILTPWIDRCVEHVNTHPAMKGVTVAIDAVNAARGCGQKPENN